MLGKSKSVKKQSNLHGKEVFWQTGRRQSCCPEDWTTVEQWRGICYSLFSLEKPASVASPGVRKVAQHSNAFCEYQIKLLIQTDSREKDEMKKETEMEEERRDTVWECLNESQCKVAMPNLNAHMSPVFIGICMWDYTVYVVSLQFMSVKISSQRKLNWKSL